MRLAFAVTACLLACACDTETKSAEPAPAPPVAAPAEPAAPAPAPSAPAPVQPAAPAEPEDADPRVNAIRTRYQAIEAATTGEPTRKLERDCGETKVAAQLYEGEGLQKAIVRFNPPGDASFVYRLYFDQQQPVFVLYSQLGFAGGTTTLTEHRLYLADQKPVRCLTKSAKNLEGEDLSELEIVQRIQQAANQEGDCKHAERALTVARTLTGEKDTQAALGKLCKLSF